MILATFWTVLLFTFAGFCYFGVKNERGVSSVLAFAVGVTLGASGFFALGEMARAWTGYPYDVTNINLVTLGALVFSWTKCGDWVLHGRV